jgi:hypothetical protein
VIYTAKGDGYEFSGKAKYSLRLNCSAMRQANFPRIELSEKTIQLEASSLKLSRHFQAIGLKHLS